MLDGAIRADFCVGYFNLRGWGKIIDHVEKLKGKDGTGCRLLIGMEQTSEYVVRHAYQAQPPPEISQKQVHDNMQTTLTKFSRQLELGCPTAEDERNLQRLKEQLSTGQIQIKFHGRHPLHAKLYLIHRPDSVAALAGVVGSSNLTLAGLEKNGELNVDVLDQDAAQKLSAWFEERWQDGWSVDITEALAKVITNSWAGGNISPYHVYLKTAYELSRDAIQGVNEYPLPHVFRDEILEFQEQAVAVAAKILEKQGGVVIGDVVGLGKTMTACAVAKTFQEDHGDNILVVCPPNLKDMWKSYIHKYCIAADTFSIGMMQKLKELRRYKIIIVDESHNFRNRNTSRYGHLQDYIRENESRVILLTATPYNKAFTDIANQLRLFVDADRDLGIRPEQCIQEVGGAQQFKAKHSQTLISSLAAFEKSEHLDDWRELMRLFMVRRTRSHIKKHYAEYDKQRKQHYLTFSNNKRFYFPGRIPKRLDFSFGNTSDDYTLLYSQNVVSTIGKLELPRYGIGGYINPDTLVAESDQPVIDNLTRARQRLRGFARSGLFKRLESGGWTFLLSVRRHIIRNAVFIAALDAKDGALPIGQISAAETDEAFDEQDDQLVVDDAEPDVDDSLAKGKAIYEKLRDLPEFSKRFKWVPGHYFLPSLREHLASDMQSMSDILNIISEWQSQRDRKFQALLNLVKKTHGKDKILIFTQFKDTAEYLFRELRNADVERIELAHSDRDMQAIVNRFSPKSNQTTDKATDNELRVLVTTDVLSEGQNLQDAHIIVNYDLPWAIIRLVQRAGRIDRIGQEAREILCYSAFPEAGIEKIISLRERLHRRMKDNAELIGTDERFFEGDQQTREQALRDLYDGSAQLEEVEDETDLLSRAYDIWRQAERADPKLAKKIKQLPDVIYSAKSTTDNDGVIAYIRRSGSDVLAHLDTDGNIISQAQSHILDMLECSAQTPTSPIADHHHECVRNAVRQIFPTGSPIGGQLGSNRSVRHKIYTKLKLLLQIAEKQPLLTDVQGLNVAVQAIYDYPLTETARDRIRRLLHAGVTDDVLRDIVLNLHTSKNLCIKTGQRNNAPAIICSMGLIDDTGS